MEMAAATVQSHLSLALLTCSQAVVTVTGIDDTGRRELESWQAERVKVSIRIPLSAETAAKMAAKLVAAGCTEVEVASVHGTIHVGTTVRTREMQQVIAFADDDAAAGIGSIQFGIDAGEVAAVEASWLRSRKAEDAAYAARDSKPPATCRNPECGASFYPTSGSAGLYCTTDCHNAHLRAQREAGVKPTRVKREPPGELKCPGCGTPFVAKQRAGGEFTKSCSRACGMRIRAATIRARQTAAGSR